MDRSTLQVHLPCSNYYLLSVLEEGQCLLSSHDLLEQLRATDPRL